MKPFDNCPVCGGELVTKKVEKILMGGNNTAVINVDADVCIRCGERLYSKETVEMFNEIREKLLNNEVSDFIPLGQSYKVA